MCLVHTLSVGSHQTINAMLINIDIVRCASSAITILLFIIMRYDGQMVKRPCSRVHARSSIFHFCSCQFH